jgi:hypothetical protein
MCMYIYICMYAHVLYLYIYDMYIMTRTCNTHVCTSCSVGASGAKAAKGGKRVTGGKGSKGAGEMAGKSKVEAECENFPQVRILLSLFLSLSLSLSMHTCMNTERQERERERGCDLYAVDLNTLTHTQVRMHFTDFVNDKTCKSDEECSNSAMAVRT